MSDDNDRIEQIAATWLARRDARPLSVGEQQQLDAWLSEDVAHRVAWLRLEAVWCDAARLEVLGAGTVADEVPARGKWQHSPYFATRTDETVVPIPSRTPVRARPRRRGLLRAAVLAVVVIAAGATGGFIVWRNATHVERGHWRTAIGQQQSVQLPDGSMATLGGHSELRVAMSRDTRKVTLVRGEAYFQDVDDPSRPFVVMARGYRVTAIGTRFDVRQGPTGVRVVVTQGLVRLQSATDAGQPPATLSAGSVALASEDAVVVHQVPPDQLTDYLHWRNGYVVFHGTPLVQAVADFNRYNPQRIVIADPSLNALRVGGRFQLTNGDAFVRLLQAMFPIQVEQRGNQTVLTRRRGTSATR